MTPRKRLPVELGPLLAVVFMMIDEMRSVVIHVTAAGPGEGTSTVARELAIAAASSAWCKVALLEARRGNSLDTSPGVPKAGLIDRFERSEEIALQPERIGDVTIFTGRLSTNGLSTPRVQSLRGLYGLLRSSYSLVVVECSPVLSGQDAAMLVSAADGTLLVVEAERTPISEVVRAREVLEQLGASVLGVVLNKQRNRIPKFLAKLI